jgi:hypothetical protein
MRKLFTSATEVSGRPVRTAAQAASELMFGRSTERANGSDARDNKPAGNGDEYAFCKRTYVNYVIRSGGTYNA